MTFVSGKASLVYLNHNQNTYLGVVYLLISPCAFVKKSPLHPPPEFNVLLFCKSLICRYVRGKKLWFIFFPEWCSPTSEKNPSMFNIHIHDVPKRGLAGNVNKYLSEYYIKKEKKPRPERSFGATLMLHLFYRHRSLKRWHYPSVTLAVGLPPSCPVDMGGLWICSMFTDSQTKGFLPFTITIG